MSSTAWIVVNDAGALSYESDSTPTVTPVPRNPLALARSARMVFAPCEVVLPTFTSGRRLIFMTFSPPLLLIVDNADTGTQAETAPFANPAFVPVTSAPIVWSCDTNTSIGTLPSR